MTSVVAVDIGGTHARFALAEVDGGRVVSLDEAVTLKTAEHASLQTAWEDFGRQVGAPLPRAAAGPALRAAAIRAALESLPARQATHRVISPCMGRIQPR